MYTVWSLLIYLTIGWILPIGTMPFIFSIIGIMAFVETYKAIGLKGMVYSALFIFAVIALIVIL